MSFSSWLFGTSNAQGAAEAQANLDKLRAARIAQLRPKIEAGTATPAQIEEWKRLTGETATDQFAAEDDLEAGWDTFEEESWENVKALPGNIKSGVGSVTQWVGETVGGASGGLLKGLFKGWANPVTIGLLIVIVVVVGWAFLKGPLKGAKVKFIPI